MRLVSSFACEPLVHFGMNYADVIMCADEHVWEAVSDQRLGLEIPLAQSS